MSLPAPCAPAPLWGLLWGPLPERRLCAGLVWSGAKRCCWDHILLGQDLLGGVGRHADLARVITTIPASALSSLYGFTEQLLYADTEDVAVNKSNKIPSSWPPRPVKIAKEMLNYKRR